MITFLAPAVRWAAALFPRGEEPAAFENHTDAQIFPMAAWPGRVPPRPFIRLPPTSKPLTVGGDAVLERAVNRVVLEQVRECLGTGDIVNRNKFQV